LLEISPPPEGVVAVEDVVVSLLFSVPVPPPHAARKDKNAIPIKYFFKVIRFYG